jgi:hypothetical protein
MDQTYTSNAFSIVSDPVRMADRIMQFSLATDAEALKLLRFSFPDSPLSLRVAALYLLMRHKPRHPAVLQT